MRIDGCFEMDCIVKLLGPTIALAALITSACIPQTPAPGSPPAQPKAAPKKSAPAPTTTTTPPVAAANEIVTVPASSPGGYEITLRFIQSNGAIKSSQKAVFSDAASRWSSLITGDLAPRDLNFGAGHCRNGLPAFNGTVDDLLIDVLVAPIDGPSGVLGSAGPCLLRSDSALPVYGIMVFDSADVDTYQNNGGLEGLILHEMGHVMGIGTIWDRQGFLQAKGTSDPRFTGTNGANEWFALSGETDVPVANTGGAGTAGSHWRESIFDNELMTGYIDDNMPISRVTVGSLEDIGYEVDYSKADPFSTFLKSMRSAGESDATERVEIQEEILTPIGTV